MVALEHKSVYRDVEGVAAEKSQLAAAVRAHGVAILNGDDPLAAAMAAQTNARVVHFGRREGNDYRALDARAVFPERLQFTLAWRGGILPLRTRFVAEHFWLPAAAAAAAALELGVAPDTVADRLASFEPFLDRCGAADIPGGPHFIVDTAKAPWHSVKLAFDVLASATAPRKRIVLGHISDSSSNDRTYRNAYRMARAVADEVIFVGDHAHRSKASQNDYDTGRFQNFVTAEQVASYIRATTLPGEVILLKGSVGQHLERIALAWMHEVRCWVPACGHRKGCIECGRYGESFDWHKGRRRRHRVRRFLSGLVGKARPRATRG
jgi:UDP-N-acetylmuramoyl-tripeptide--D-alanyl-D-alanine ligase